MKTKTSNIITIEPHSPEWYKLHHENLTASEVAAFYDVNFYKTPISLYYEKRLDEPQGATAPHHPSYIRLEAGKYLEGFIKGILEIVYEIKTHDYEGMAMHPRVERFGASPDYWMRPAENNYEDECFSSVPLR